MALFSVCYIACNVYDAIDVALLIYSPLWTTELLCHASTALAAKIDYEELKAQGFFTRIWWGYQALSDTIKEQPTFPTIFLFFFFSLGLKPYVACKYSHLHSCLPWVISKDSLQARTGTRWQWFLIIWILIQNKSFSPQFLKVILHDPFVLYLAGYRAEIVSGKTTLQELASTESDCSSARNDGDLGFFGPGQMQSKS